MKNHKTIIMYNTLVVKSLTFFLFMGFINSTLWSQTLVEGHQHIELSTSRSGLTMKQLNDSNDSNINLYTAHNKNFLFVLSGLNTDFFGTGGDEAYFFTPLGQDIPIIFATDGKERMRISEEGNIGIGDDVDFSKMLYIRSTADNVKSGIRIRIDSSTLATKRALDIDNYSNGTSLFINNEGNAAHVVRIQAHKSRAMLLQSDTDYNAFESINNSMGVAGNFVILNENSPNDALMCRTKGTGHALYVKGSAMREDASPNWNTMSDRRLKKEIKPYKDGLDKVLKINPKRFYYNGLGGFRSDQERVGVIAQDMQSIAPYMVKERSISVNPSDRESDERIENALEYDVSALPYMLVNAIKELNQKVEDLQSENAILKSKIIMLIKD